MSGNSLDSGRTVTSKLVAILMTFTEGDAHPLPEICRLTGLPVSTAYRLVCQLTAHQILVRAEDGAYRAGQCLQAFAVQESPPETILDWARPVMEDLSLALRTHVRLGVFYDLAVAYIEKSPGHQPITRFAPTATVPAHATALGKVLLAFAHPEVVDAVIAQGLTRYTPFTLTSSSQLRKALALIRLSRTAVCRRELDPRVAELAMPVLDPAGQVVFAALSVRAGDPDMDLRVMHPALLVAARSLSRSEGIRDILPQQRSRSPTTNGPLRRRSASGVWAGLHN